MISHTIVILKEGQGHPNSYQNGKCSVLYCNNHNDNDCISTALFHAKHAQLR